MTPWFRGKSGGLLAFLGISIFVLSALAWATHEALRLERESRLAQAEKIAQERTRVAEEQAQEKWRQAKQERIDQLRLALWRLDSRLSPPLSREDSRPYPNYVAIHSPFAALTSSGAPCGPNQIFLPSPLLTAELPDWITLHFQVDAISGWTSPQVVSEALEKSLRKQPLELALNNCTQERAKLLDELKRKYPPKSIQNTFQCRGLAWHESERKLNAIIDFASNLDNNNNRGGNGYQDRLTPPPPQTPQTPPDPTQQIQTNSSPLQNAQLGNGITNEMSQKGNLLNSIPPEFQEFYRRSVLSSRAKSEGQRAFLQDGRNYVGPPQPPSHQKTMTLTEQPVEVELASMKPFWLPDAGRAEHLLMVRSVLVGERLVFQGFVCDWTKLQLLLKNEIEDLFPEARFIPLPEGDPPSPERTMTALPVELDPNLPDLGGPEHFEPEPAEPFEFAAIGWTPLRLGLGFAWFAAVVALLAVGLGGWSLLDLSERRIRFVSAVTHELRTPMTTLRLYLDLLSTGMVTDPKQRDEYLKTMNGESDRLNRLITNVLDFARLEKSRPTVEKRPVALKPLLEQLRSTWEERCLAAGKELTIDYRLPEEAAIETDAKLVEQILCNLIDNAQKYSRDATDPKIVLRARREGKRTIFEVEDRGPGISRPERSSIFRAFRRGRHADVKAGGVGLGLALATRWASLIHGRLSVEAGEGNVGACFRLEL